MGIMARYRASDVARELGLSRQRVHQFCKNRKVARDELGFIIDNKVVKQIMESKGRRGRPRKAH